MPKVVAVLNQKGGSGKTTIATNLACALQADGDSVLLVDADPQGSARGLERGERGEPHPGGGARPGKPSRKTSKRSGRHMIGW